MNLPMFASTDLGLSALLAIAETVRVIARSYKIRSALTLDAGCRFHITRVWNASLTFIYTSNLICLKMQSQHMFMQHLYFGHPGLLQQTSQRREGHGGL